MKKVLKYCSILALLVVAASGVAGYVMVDYALKPDELVTRSRNMEASMAAVYEDYPEVQTWMDSLQQAGGLYDLYREADDGRRLHALFIPAARPTERTAVVVHGYTDNAIRMLPIGYLYSKVMNYNVLLPDLNGHGLSEGAAVQMGWKDRQDVLQWIEQAAELTGDICKAAEVPGYNPRIVMHGISMGAATTMMVAGEVEHGIHQLPYVKCFVEDCGYTSAWDEFKGELKNRFGLPAFPVLHFASWFCDLRYGWNFKEASALEQVKKCSLPMLFIHGTADTFVPTWMVHPLYDAKSQPKELWLVPEVDHAHSYRDCKAEYTRRVRDFVEKYM